MQRSQPPTIRLFFVIVVLFAAASAIYAERLPVKIYTSADGLSSSFVNNIKRDSRGFIWICTRDGLSRFDGERFVTYQVGAENPALGIETIYETRGGDYLGNDDRRTVSFQICFLICRRPARQHLARFLRRRHCAFLERAFLDVQ